MILGRPANQWIGLVSAAAALLQVLLVQLRPDLDPVAVATIIGSVTAFLGVVILFVAGQPPTVTSGDTVTVQTPANEPNRSVTVI